MARRAGRVGAASCWAGVCTVALHVAACRHTPESDHVTTVKIVAFNDFHGHLTPDLVAPAGGEPGVMAGGIDYLAAYVAELTGENPNHVVVAAGDLVGASPILSSYYHDEATVEALNELGLTMSAVGNHEFDAGPAELLRKQQGGCFPLQFRTCLHDRVFPGARFQYLAANVVRSTDGGTLLPPYVIERFGAVRVAFIGVGLHTTPSIETPQGVAGLTFDDEADTVNALIPELHAQGIHAIVVLIHQGGTQSAAASANAANDCAGQLGGAQSPIVDVVSRLDDAVDVVVSGHTHEAYNCRLPNRAGRAIPVTQAGYHGHLLTNIDLGIGDRTGRVTRVTTENVLVSHPAADAPGSPVHPYLSSTTVTRLRRLVDEYAAAARSVANSESGVIAAPLTNEPGPAGEAPAGDLIADSELAATAAAGGARIAFVNQGGVRPPGFDTAHATYPHTVTFQEAFAVRPFGDTLVTVSLTARDIKDLLEQQFAGCAGQTLDRFLQVSKGLHIEWSASGTPCSKIVSVTLDEPDGRGPGEALVEQGRVPHPTHAYRVTVDNFLAAGGDAFTVLSRGTQPLVGGTDMDALTGYLSTAYAPGKPPYDPHDPASRIPRITRLP